MKSVYKIEKNEFPEKTIVANQVREGWDNAFKQAIANGDTPENDMFEGLKNAFDDSEW
jgi:hypothetical protein